MLRSFLVIALMVLSLQIFAQTRTTPPNVIDQNLVGFFNGIPSGFNVVTDDVKTCTVSFSYDHEEKLGSTILVYYKVKINFPNLNYDMNYLKPSDFEFMVSKDFLLNSYPKNFVQYAFSAHRNDYRAIRLKFDEKNKISVAQTAYGITGNATSRANWSWLSAYTCHVKN